MSKYYNHTGVNAQYDSDYSIGTLVKMRSVEELLKVNEITGIGCFTQYTAEKYANRYALIIDESRNKYELYFPDTDDTHAWNTKYDFEPVDDLLALYRPVQNDEWKTKYKYMWGYYQTFDIDNDTYKQWLNEAVRRHSPIDIIYFDAEDHEIRLSDLAESAQNMIVQTLKDHNMIKEPYVGARICVNIKGLRNRTPVWTQGYKGTIVKLNPKTVGVKLDAYPNEIQKIDYGDYDYLE